MGSPTSATIDDGFEVVDNDGFEVVGYDSPEYNALKAGDDFEVVGKERESDDFVVVPSKNKIPQGPPAVTKYLGFLGHESRRQFMSKNKDEVSRIVKERAAAGEDFEAISKDLTAAGWDEEAQGEFFYELVPEDVRKEQEQMEKDKQNIQVISVDDAFKSFNKNDLLKLTPNQINDMSDAQKEYFFEQMDNLAENQGREAVLNGLAIGGFEFLRNQLGIEEPKSVNPLLKGIGEMAGSLPLYLLGNEKIVEPIANLVKNGPVAKAVVSILGNAGLLATEQSLKRVITKGELPALEEYTGYLADVAVLEGTLRGASQLPPFKRKLKAVSEATGIPESEILERIVTQYHADNADTAIAAIDAIGKEKIGPQSNAEALTSTSGVTAVDAKLPGGMPELKMDVVSTGEKPVETSTVQSKPKPLAKEKKPKPKPKKKPKPKGPVEVDIPAEDIGKTPEQVLDKHVQTGKAKWSFKLPSLKKTAQVLETHLYNRFAPLKVLGEGEASVFNKPREMAELVKGSVSKAQASLRLAQYDAATGVAVGPAFEQIFLPKRLKQLTGASKLDRAAFDKYLAARTTLERQKLGHASGIPTKTAQQYVRQNNGRFAALANDIYTFGRNQINNLVKKGLVSEDGAKAMFKMYESHVPLFRVMPEELTLRETITEGLTGKTPADKAPQTPGASNLTVKKPLQAAKGSTKQILSPTESIVKNTYAFESAMAKNDAMRAAGRGLEKNGFKVTKVGKPKMSDKAIADSLGMDIEDLEMMVDDIGEVGEAIQFLNPEQPRGKLRWFENGDLYEVNAPKDVLQAVEGLSPHQTNFVMKVLNSWKNTFSLGTVLQPGTLMRLSGMDMFVSTLQSKYPMWNGLLEFPSRVVYEYPRMLFNILKKGDLYSDYMASGAAQVSLQGLDRQMLESMTDTLINAMKRENTLLKDTLMFPITASKAIFNTLRNTSEILGDIPRLLEFERSMAAAIKRGATKPEAMAQAAFDAFEVSVPYGRKGASGSLQAVYQMMPFVNTIVNSGVSMAKALNPSNPNFQGVVAAGLSYLTFPTVSLYLKNRTDPRYQQIPQKDRDQNVYVFTTDDPDEEPLKFRKMWQYGYLFQTVPEHMVEFMLTKDPKAFDGLGASFEYEFSPLTMISISSAFSDGKFDPVKLLEGSRVPLIPARQKKIDAELQQTANTSETAKVLAQYFHISPIYIDHLVSQTGGGLGRDVIRLSDEFMYQTGSVVDRRPQKQSKDSIFFGTFYGRGPSKSNEYLNKFYTYVDKYETIENSAKALYAQGRDDEGDKMMDKYVNVKKMRSKLGKYYKAIEQIRNEHPDDLNGVEKRKELNQIYRDMTVLAKELVEDIESQAAANK